MATTVYISTPFMYATYIKCTIDTVTDNVNGNVEINHNVC